MDMRALHNAVKADPAADVQRLKATCVPPARFDYSAWRHGGWYVGGVVYPCGAVGCVSRNYPDGKWRWVCDGRPFEQRPRYQSRHDAALAEWHHALAQY